jgi:hypothetical protein
MPAMPMKASEVVPTMAILKVMVSVAPTPAGPVPE